MGEKSCHHDCGGACNHGSTATQSLDELEFQRGLWTAAINGDLQKIQNMLKNGTNVNSQDDYGYTPLIYSVRYSQARICKYLIDNGADLNLKSGATALHRAAYLGNNEIVELLVSRGASINQQDCDGMTPLHKANEQGHFNTIKLLLSAGADSSIRDKKGKTPQEYRKG